MKFKIGDRVRIINNGIIGEVIDTTTHRMTGKRFYLIETMDEMVIDDPRAYQAPHPIFTCSPDEIELIHKTQDAI